MFIGCTSPLIRVATRMEDGKIADAKIYSSRYGQYAEMAKNGQLPPGAQLIPCGQCLECRLQYARNWADRCMLEAKYHKNNYFLTLTYDDKHVSFCPDTGALSLNLADLQTFVKRLRNYIRRKKDTKGEPLYPDAKVRYFACGEYGETTKRPHLHMILFGLPFELDDLTFFNTSDAGCNVYTSEWLDSIWTNGKVFIGEVTWESCCYVARYVTKKVGKGNKEFYEDFGIVPEFIVMSRRPGIGRDFFNDHKSMYAYDEIYISTEKGSLRVKPPRYFDKLYELENPDDMQRVKIERGRSGRFAMRGKLLHTDLDFAEYNKLSEQVSENRTKILKRGVI